MGIDIHTYGIYGVRIDYYDSDFSEAYDDLYDTCPLDIIMDGMGGDYMVFGKILFNSGNFRYGADDGDDLTLIATDPETLANIEKEYKLEFTTWFPKFYTHMDKPFQLMMFTHYS